ncbi:phosphatidylserine decarboxylase family protein [Rhodohalobacter sulfatireducens]|uniref:Phosphatidylserine decarboxylase proenzyme n=1 Tax=Rhodohalobacter sulfatireducens TaxID=2911366 RepID=A0ABS9KFZ7_9BACT|nr:phosphatidylserine decarboxylase family protein [Rhodohalobacter sulfatireducens]MCG2589787.1 phosphatidylserine decarboxylase family protein [Rhodohalobacter sulfatireducens]
MIAREGYSTILVVFLFSILVAFGASFGPNWLGTIIYPLLIILCGLILYFFRDPKRTSPTDNRLILSPADGRVVLIQQVNEDEYIGGPATQISIFLSPLDVHVNRVPVTGKLEFLKYYPGKYLMAWEDHASDMNERAHFGVKHKSGMKILFKQITGFMARRIVYHLEEGESIQAGKRFGIMKFGSRMDVLLPENVNIRVQKGDRTVAGESIIAEIS